MALPPDQTCLQAGGPPSCPRPHVPDSSCLLVDAVLIHDVPNAASSDVRSSENEHASEAIRGERLSSIISHIWLVSRINKGLTSQASRRRCSGDHHAVNGAVTEAGWPSSG
jgi:hypothetical protein